MNKKFSTLLAGFLLAGVVGTSAQVNSFENGKAYVLSNGTNVLAVNASAPGVTPTLTVVAHPGSTTTLTNLQKSLWRVNVTPGVNGANPTYTFVNVYTGTPLAIDPAVAVVATTSATVAAAAAQMGGSVSAWQNDPAYNPITPTTQFPIYSTFSNGGKDSVYVLAGQTASLSAGNYVGVVKEAKSKLNDLTAGFKVKPYAATGISLTAQDLNTQLGTVPATSGFALTFTPNVQNAQWGNLLTQSFIATDAKNTNGVALGTGSSGKPILQLRENKSGSDKYLYVDTAYVAEQNIAYDDLNLKFAVNKLDYSKMVTADGKYMLSRRSFFTFDYFATSDSIVITAGNTDKKPEAVKYWSEMTQSDITSYNSGVEWSGDYFSTKNNSLVKLVYLTEQTSTTAAHSEVTVGAAEAATGMIPATTLRTRISLGMPQNYTPGVPADGVYIIKVKATGANAVNKDGRYYIDNLAGNKELAIKAVRQNYQDMPATQWVVKSVGTIATITNREFKNQLETPALMYKAGDNYFYYGKDTMEFIPVTKTDDSKLGYNYLSADTLSDHVFTFNYLHELAMDKPINTKLASDSVVWVDKDGNKMTFSLERLIDDTYGYTGGLTGVAGLTRSVYYIKVNDASKLQNDGRYLTYDESRKQYVVKNYAGKNITSARNYVAQENVTSSTLTINGETTVTSTPAEALAALKTEAPMPFFLKENNEVEGGACYYTLIPAELAVVKNGDYLKLVVKDEAYKPAIITTFTDADQKATSTDGTITTTATSEYATVKVSVDNNTLALVNGVINDGSANEVANSAFAVVMDNTPLYRRLNDATVGENADDTPNVLKFFRVNSTAKEYLYEDANSKYSEGLGVNFLGVEGKGDAKNAAMYVDTAYVKRGTKMPQYMLVLNPTIVKADTVWCNATSTHTHATLADSLACPHTTITRGSVEGRFLINLQDSADAVTTPYANKYLWNTKYTRLAFVEGKHIGDTLFIAKAAAEQDTILLDNNMHKNAVFSFRLLKNDSNDFLIESETQKNGANIKNADLDVVSIAPQKGGWVKIQNGVPVIANYQSYSEAGLDAEVFNVEATDEAPTANDAISTSEVSIIAGNGTVTIKGAEGKTVAITNVLGQTVASTVISSSEATIAVPAGVVVVAVEGEAAVKAIVK